MRWTTVQIEEFKAEFNTYGIELYLINVFSLVTSVVSGSDFI